MGSSDEESDCGSGGGDDSGVSGSDEAINEMDPDVTILSLDVVISVSRYDNGSKSRLSTVFNGGMDNAMPCRPGFEGGCCGKDESKSGLTGESELPFTRDDGCML